MTFNIYKAIKVMKGLKLGKEPCCPHPCALCSAWFKRRVLEQMGWQHRMESWGQSQGCTESKANGREFTLPHISSRRHRAPPQTWLAWRSPSVFRAPAMERIPLEARVICPYWIQDRDTISMTRDRTRTRL